MRCWGITDKGSVRAENQDALRFELFTPESGKETAICVVCDGMGGAKAGNVASAIAVSAFMDEALSGIVELRPKRELVSDALRKANELILEKARESNDYNGMGTTLVAAVADEDGAVILNVGDSRCYHINNDGISQITKDHSLVEDMIDRGEILREEAWRHPSKNLITRALGGESGYRCDIFEISLEPEDCILLCSDGLSNVVNPQELLFEVKYGGDLDSAVTRMLDIALARQAPDNVTALIIAR